MQEKQGNGRNKMLVNNILFSGLLKLIGLCTSFLIVPVTLGYLDNESYGLWMTISSIGYLVFSFDIGLGNGMRNYLTAAISSNDYETARIYVSSTFAMITTLACIIGAVGTVCIYLLDFNEILNTSSLSNATLRTAILAALILTLVQFVVKNIGFIYVAMQKYAINDLLTIGGNVLALLLIFLLTKTTDGNLLYVIATFMGMPVLTFLLGSIPLFSKHPALRPSAKSIDIKFSIGIIKKGIGFFIIQVTSCLIIFGGSNLFISHFQGPETVTTYNIAYKYFNLLIISYTIIIAPMWNAYTDAYVKGDWQWIHSTFKRALIIWGASVLAGAVMLIGSNIFYKIWVGEAVTVPLSVSASVLVFVLLFNLNNCVTYLLNGLNTIMVQIYTSIIATAFYIFVIAVYGDELSLESIVLSMAFCYAAMSLTHLYQCRLIILQKATGIWKR